MKKVQLEIKKTFTSESCRLELYDNGIHSRTRESNLNTNTER